MIANHGPTLRDFLEQTYLPRHLLAPMSAANYRGTVALLDRWAGQPVAVGQITPELVGHYLAWLRTQGRAQNTLRKHRRQLRAILQEARRDGLTRLALGRLPQLKPERRVPRAWTVAEFTALVAAAGDLPGHVGPWPTRHWLPALLLTCWSTDWRISAVMSLETAAVDLATGAAAAYERKTCEERHAWLTAQTCAALTRIWSPSRREVFGDWPYDRRRPQWPALNNLLRRTIAAAGIRDLGRFHAIRRTSTTAIAAAHGLDAAAQHAGHSLPHVTQRHYVDPSHLAATAARLPDLASRRDAQLRLF